MRLAATIALACASLRAAVALDPLIGDHMVLQRDQPIVLRGTAEPGESVSVFLGSEQVAIRADTTGNWEARLRPRTASKTPVALRAKAASGEAKAEDVLVGDVWICAGQSNMEFAVGREQKANVMEAAKHWSATPLLRLRNHSFPGQYSSRAIPAADLARLKPGTFFSGNWETCTDKSTKAFSAVGWWFGLKLQQATGVPIGLVNWSIGGAPIETFIRREAFTGAPELEAKLMGVWTENPAIDEWVRTRAKAHFGKAKEPRDALGIEHFYKPGFAWAAGPGRATWMPVRGWLWYQGESNSLSESGTREYPMLLKAMVADWRAQWKLPEAPFLWVQLSSIDTAKYKSAQWPLFRDQQRRLLTEIPNSGMAVCSDLGAKDDVHPRDKRPVGERLARWALNTTYGQRNVVPSGPLAASASAQGAKVTVRFNFARGLKASDGTPVREIEVAGADGAFVTATATTQGETLVVTSPVAQPKAVRYGWVPWSQGNLVNGEGLPASTFALEIK